MKNNVQPKVKGLSFAFDFPKNANADINLLIAMLSILKGKQVALLPYGAITKAFRETLKNQSHSLVDEENLHFFDKTAQPTLGVNASAEITPESADIFLVLTHSFDVELTKFLKGKGVDHQNIWSIRHFPEYIQRDYWQPAATEKLVNSLPKTDNFTILLTDCAESALVEHFSEKNIKIDITMDMQTSGVNRDVTVTIPHSFPSASSLPSKSRIIAVCLPQHYATIYHHLKDISAEVELILPFADKDVTFHPPQRTPTIFLSFPHAGHGRFAPVLTSIAGQLNRKQTPWPMLSKNHRFAEVHNNSEPSELQKLIERDFSSQITRMEWFDYAVTHDIYDLTALTEQEWNTVTIAQLIRDPRDILTSVVMRLDADNFETTCLRFLQGDFYFKSTTNLLYWPSVKEICRRFAFGMSHKQVFTVRFEDLHNQPEKTYRAMCAWLGWDDENQPKLSATDLGAAIQLGSFAHQTQNKLVRGEQSTVLIGSCRKGIIGDWKNHWTPLLVKTFKQLCNEEFMALGYEQDEHWM